MTILNSLYTYVVIISVLSMIIYYALKTVEAKRNIRIFPYSVRKQFIEELKGASDVAYELFERRLLKNGFMDGLVSCSIGIILSVSIILEGALVPFNLRIVLWHGTLNYYFFAYFSDLFVFTLLLFLPLIMDIKIITLGILRLKELQRKMNEETEISQLDETMNERKQIRLYHYIKNFVFVSVIVAIGLFIQSIIIEGTPYFYYQKNLLIDFLPLEAFVIFVLIIILMGRIRIAEMYEIESKFLMWLAFLPGTHKTLLLKTSKNGIFAGNPKICYLEGIGKKLKITYEWKKELFVSYVKWKDVVAFGLPYVKLNEIFERVLEEKGINTDSEIDE